MKSKLQRNIFLLILGLLLTCAIVEWQFHVLQRGYDHFMMDNRNHYLSCEELPTKIEVERVMEQHKDVVQQIQQVAPGFVEVEVDSFTCEGKADLLISYGTHEQRVAIEKIIAGDTFFGIPYRLRNY